MRPFSRTVAKVALLVAGAGMLVACVADAPVKRKRSPARPGDDYYDDGTTEEIVPLEPIDNPDSGVFGAPSRPASGDGGSRAGDGGTIAAPKNVCPGPLQPGDLAIVELMIASKTGAGDTGEWLEIQSTRDCWLRLKGVSIESPRGEGNDGVMITEDFELAPNATFVVAGSLDPAKTGILVGKVFAWDATDVLKNDGDTIRVRFGPTLLDELTYPSFSNLTPGRSIAFPNDCVWPLRPSWDRWSLTFAEFAPGLKGTPNAPNGDVACY